MTSNEEEEDDHKGKVKKRPGNEIMASTSNEERPSNKMKTTATFFNANSSNNSNVAMMPSDGMTEQETDATSLFFSILPKIYHLQSLLADLACLETEEMKPSMWWGCQGVNRSESEEISRRIYRKVWRVKKITDDDDGPMLVWALCVIVEHLTQCFHRKKSKLSELDKKIVFMIGNSLHSVHGNIDKKDLVWLMDNLKLTLFKNIDFAWSIASNCNVDGSEPGEFECNDLDTAKEREEKYLKMLCVTEITTQGT